MLHIYAALAEKERRMIGERTRAGLAAAKKRGVKLGGLNAKGIAEQQAARERAEQLRPIFEELAELSARKTADELNRRGVTTPARRGPAGRPAAVAVGTVMMLIIGFVIGLFVGGSLGFVACAVLTLLQRR